MVEADSQCLLFEYDKNDIVTGQGSNRGGVVLSVINTLTYAPIWNPGEVWMV